MTASRSLSLVASSSSTHTHGHGAPHRAGIIEVKGVDAGGAVVTEAPDEEGEGEEEEGD